MEENAKSIKDTYGNFKQFHIETGDKRKKIVEALIFILYTFCVKVKHTTLLMVVVVVVPCVGCWTSYLLRGNKIYCMISYKVITIGRAGELY